MNLDLLALTHGGEAKESYLNAVTPPVFMNSLHVYDSWEEYEGASQPGREGFYYGRLANPTTRILEDKIAALEHGARAAAFSSGMAAATTAVFATCRTGSHIICQRDVYHPLRSFLNDYVAAKLGMAVTYVSGHSLAELEAAIRPNTHLMLLESPATFVFTVIDIAAVAALAKKHGVITYLDNTCCTPLYQKPLDLGIDLVMHSLSKYIGGHSDVIGGVLVSKNDDLMDEVLTRTRWWCGGILGPMEAWLAIRGLRSLDARLRCHGKTALAVAEYLEGHPKVRRVNYTGLASHPQRDVIARQQKGHTGLVSFYPDCTAKQATELINRLKLFGKGCSWGGFESLALVPLYGRSDDELEFLNLPHGRSLVRIHCGLEGEDNLLADLEQALRAL